LQADCGVWRQTRSSGPAATLRRRFLKVIAPITLVVVVVSALIVMAAARLLIFPVYSETVTLLLGNLARDIVPISGDPKAVEELLRRVSGNDKFAFLLAAADGRIAYCDKAIFHPRKLLHEVKRWSLTTDRPRVRISGFGPGLRLLGAIRLPDDALLLVRERGQGDFGALYKRLFGGGLALVVFGVAAASWLCSWLIFAPLWARMRELEGALREYGEGRMEVRLPLDEKAGRDGFLLVFFAFNRMADTIVTLAAEKEKRAEAERLWLSGLAHDLNTPMTIMRGQAENLVEHGESLGPDEQRQRLREILAQSLYMQALVEDLLTAASARTRGLELSLEMVELGPLYDVLIETFHHPAVRKGVALVADDQGLAVRADPLRLRQMLVNLIRNALIHADELHCIELLAARSGRGVLVIVQDDGSGLDEDDAERVFQAGERGDEARAAGWGLGLAVVRMLAEAHGGGCRLARGPEGGARFEIWLPDAGGGTDWKSPRSHGTSPGLRGQPGGMIR